LAPFFEKIRSSFFGIWKNKFRNQKEVPESVMTYFSKLEFLQKKKFFDPKYHSENKKQKTKNKKTN